jgi:hypothetical protein
MKRKTFFISQTFKGKQQQSAAHSGQIISGEKNSIWPSLDDLIHCLQWSGY